MSNFNLSQKFGAIILCNSSFLHLPSSKKKDLLKSVKRSLLPGGIFFLEYESGFTETWDWGREKKIYPPVEGRYSLMLRKNVFDRDSGIAERYYKFVNEADPMDCKEFHTTGYPIDHNILKSYIQESKFQIIKEEDAFPQEKAEGKQGRRCILFLQSED